MPVFGKESIKNASYVDEGSVTFGDISPKAAKVRREIKRKELAAKKAKAKALKIARLKKRQERLKLLKQQKNKISKQIKRNIAIKNKRASIYSQAIEQDSMGYEYSCIHGSPYAGFSEEGETLKPHFTHLQGQLDNVEDFGMMVQSGIVDTLGSYDDGLGWGIKIKRPKIKISAPKITAPSSLKAAVKDVGQVAAKVATAPTQLAVGAIKATPIVKDAYVGVDKLTGGTLSKMERIAELPNKVAAGKPISKAELLEVAMTAVQVGAIVASGGSAASLVSAGAGMLKSGPLGESAFGKNILTLAEVAGASAAIYQAASANAAKTAATEASKDLAKEAAQTTSKEIAKKTMSESVKEAVKAKSLDMAKTKAMDEVQKKTGVPVGVAMSVYNISKMKGDISEKAKVFAKKIGEEQLKKAGLSDSMAQATLSGNAEALKVMIKNAPNLAMDKAKREIEAKKVQLIESVKVENLRKKVEAKIAKATDKNKYLQQLQDKIEKEANSAVKKQLEKLMVSNLKSYVKENEDYQQSAIELETLKAQASLKVAAAEEGRYDSTMDNYAHPLARYSKGFV